MSAGSYLPMLAVTTAWRHELAEQLESALQLATVPLCDLPLCSAD